MGEVARRADEGHQRMGSRPGAKDTALADAHRMRRALTPPEARLWVQLRGRQLGGLKFRRQHPIGAYVLDFYCPSLRLAVEVDGFSHASDDQAAHDRARDRWLRRLGVRVLRIPAWAVRDELDRVLQEIDQTATRLRGSGGDPHRPFGPLPPWGEERSGAADKRRASGR